MEQLYKTIETIKKLDKKPTKKEWNKIASNKGLLSTISLCCITKMNFSELYCKVKNGIYKISK